METYPSHLRRASRGFTMIEMLFAMLILSVGLVTLGSLTAQTLNGTAGSRYMGLATTLASEKLEDLNRWPYWDPHVCAASGTTVGSLTADDQAASVTCNGITDTVDYYDDVEINDVSNSDGSTTGAICETVSGLSNGSEQYTTTCHQANGTVATSTSSTANSSDVGAIAFHRRWTIEQDQPVTGVKRITVLVTLENGYLQPPVSYQMTAVRSGHQ